ncbi:MAG TPA: kinase/pyrophosphorylase [Leucothrix mucor]|nr:kinase/pyrophosphorylase [Leucothrix mucor]
MKKISRTVYFVSESTGITATSLGFSLLSQFPDVEFTHHHKPFVNTEEKAYELVEEIQKETHTSKNKPLIFATMTDIKINKILEAAPCYYYELFTRYINEISDDIGIRPTAISGMSHGLNNPKSYDNRMDIVNYALVHDDAMSMQNLNNADVILLGVSRSGKTPTCLYLALQFGLRAANYPLTEDDFLKDDIPQILKNNKEKLVGLTINPKRLAEIREKRRSASHYASRANCKTEVRHALELFNRYELNIFDTSSSSIEELSARIMQLIRKTSP